MSIDFPVWLFSSTRRKAALCVCVFIPMLKEGTTDPFSLNSPSDPSSD